MQDVPELRDILAALSDHFEKPLIGIRDAVESLLLNPAIPQAVQPHLATAATMCNDVAVLTQRYLDYIEQVQALPSPQCLAVRPDELLVEIDRQVMPEAFGRGVAWNCALDGPIRPILTDRVLCLEALLEWAVLAVESAKPGDSISLVLTSSPSEQGRTSRLSMVSTAEELISNFTSLREDPLFSRFVCLEEVGTDAGSRLALSLERLEMLGVEVRCFAADGELIRSAEFTFPEAPRSARGDAFSMDFSETLNE
ncbi:hypothetical protein [Tautonia rosea]|uniref:hypothetical protein n=1 Tax=Tautonia rosea TaxID=2728037 RepID=UPI00147398B3|nr:hypothetical protein [Tautonia rosea]